MLVHRTLLQKRGGEKPCLVTPASFQVVNPGTGSDPGQRHDIPGHDWRMPTGDSRELVLASMGTLSHQFPHLQVEC